MLSRGLTTGHVCGGSGHGVAFNLIIYICRRLWPERKVFVNLYNARLVRKLLSRLDKNWAFEKFKMIAVSRYGSCLYFLQGVIHY